MRCDELDELLADYFDGTLTSEPLARVEQHLASCPVCAGLARDIEAATAFVRRVGPVEPPPELVTRIVNETASGRHGTLRRRSGFRLWLDRLFEPVLQPRLAMSMALTILSFSMLGRLTGVEVRQLRPADLNPVRVWASVEDRTHHVWNRAVMYYESLRLVYEVQARLSEDNDAPEAAAPAQEGSGRTVPRGGVADGGPRPGSEQSPDRRPAPSPGAAK